MEEIKVTCVIDDKAVQHYLEKCTEYLKHKKIFKWIKLYLKHRELGTNKLIPIEERKRSLAFLQWFQRTIAKDIFPIPRVEEVPSIWDRAFILQDHRRIQNELMAIRKKSKRSEEHRKLCVKELLQKEGIQLSEDEIKEVVEDLSRPQADTRNAAARIVAKKHNKRGPSGVRKTIADMDQDKYGIVHVKGYKKSLKAMK